MKKKKPRQSTSPHHQADSASGKTYGLIVEGLLDFYHVEMYRGVCAAQADTGVNLICYSGNCFRKIDSIDTSHMYRMMHELASKDILDGLIFPISIRNFVPVNDFARFLDPYKGLPIVSIGYYSDAIPCVEIDNYEGMRKMVEHCIVKHHATRILFVKGLDGNADSDERFRAYTDSIKKHGIAYDDRMIIHGNFNETRSHQEVASYLKENPVPQAIICSSDDSAFGALHACSQAGLHVPRDVIVTGFDCGEAAQSSIPRLTTVNQSFRDLGSAALRLLNNYAHGAPVNRRNKLVPSLDIQESCSCRLYDGLADSRASTRAGSRQPGRKRIIEQAVSRIPPSYEIMGAQRLKQWIIRLYDILLDETGEQTLLACLDELLRETIRHELDVFAWQAPFTALSSGIAPLLATKKSVAALEKRAGNGQLYISRIGERQHIRKFRDIYWRGFDASDIQTTVSTARDLNRFNEIFCEYIKNAHSILVKRYSVALFQGISSQSWTCSRLLENPLDEAMPLPQPVLPCADYIRFYAAQAKKPFRFVVEILHQIWEPLGFALILSDHPDTGSYSSLRAILIAGIYNAKLHMRLQQQTDELAAANQQLIDMRTKEQEYLRVIRRELDLARKIQEDFLPSSLPDLEGWEMAVYFQPAQEVAGDFYDAFVLPGNRTGIVIADVSGKSVSAAIFMALVRSLIRALAQTTHAGNPLGVVSFVNDYIMKNHHRESSPYMFVTLFFGILDQETGALTYINAGHPAPVIAVQGKVRSFLDKTSPAVGIDLDSHFTAQTVQLNRGEVLFAYTDGVTESHSKEGVLLGHNMLYTVLERSALAPQSMINEVCKQVATHNAGQPVRDDITMVALKRI